MVKLDNLFKTLSQKGITQSKLAEDTSISTGNISDWKKGRSMPSAVKLDELATYFNCSVDYLLGRTDDPAPKNYINGNNNIQAINNGKNFTVNTTTKSNDLIEDFMKIFDGLSSENKIKLMYSAIELKNKGE